MWMLQPEGNLFRDRFLSMQQRALVEPRVPVLYVLLNSMLFVSSLALPFCCQAEKASEDKRIRKTCFQAVRQRQLGLFRSHLLFFHAYMSFYVHVFPCGIPM